MNFCSNCGSNQIQLEIPEGDNRLRYCCPDCDTIHYQNPNMVVGCLIDFEGKILLGRRAIEPRAGYWGLPAGFLENGESVEDGAVRETVEEVGLAPEIIRLHCVYSIPRINQIYVFFLAKVNDPTLNLGPETLEADYFLPENIPFEQIAFPSSVFAINKYLEYRGKNHPEAHIGGWKDD